MNRRVTSGQTRGHEVDEDKQPRRRGGGSWEEARVGLLPITGLLKLK